MEELIAKIKSAEKLSDIIDRQSIDPNILLSAIIRAERFDLLNGVKISVNRENNTFTEFANALLSDEDIFYSLQRQGITFSNEDINAIFSVAKQYDSSSSQFQNFFGMFYNNEKLLNVLVSENEDFFRSLVQNFRTSSFVPSSLKKSDEFIRLTIEEKRLDMLDLLNNCESYSAQNLKLLANQLQSNPELAKSDLYYSEALPQRIFDFKYEFTNDEFYHLLTLLREKNSYDRVFRDSPDSSFSSLIKDNIDFVINSMAGKEYLPKCLMESEAFRDECIKRNRFDLASQCVLPKTVLTDTNTIDGYCEALHISPKEFQTRIDWLEDYYKKNNNVFNSMLGTSLKDGIFDLDNKHFERFINDVGIQQDIAKLSPTELKVLSIILDNYSFKDYDVSMMITNIVNNIHSYKQLIDTIDVEILSAQQLKALVSVIQVPDNPYSVNNLAELENYTSTKRNHLVTNFNSNSLDQNKNNMLQALFNIDLKEGQYIYSKFCHNAEMMENLKNSELSKENIVQLRIIDKIVNCTSQNELYNLYNHICDYQIYNSELPLETYLKGAYSRLYAESIYNPTKRDQVYGPKEHITGEADYKGKKVQLYMPRENFNVLVHVTGTCSGANDKTSSNYADDWLNRPQIQDHFVCCSYISEKGVFSLRSGVKTSIIMGFNSLEGGSLLAMGNTDIDSTGISKQYNGARDIQTLNKDRAQYYVPSELTKSTISRGLGYNEVIIERRDEESENADLTKRKPDYIIMTTDSMNPENFQRLDDLFEKQLSFISEEDRLTIAGMDHENDILSVLRKYQTIIAQQASETNTTPKALAYNYRDLIMTARAYEESLKSASEFDVPLMVIDREYYFRKVISESPEYNDELKSQIINAYYNLNNHDKGLLFNAITQGKDVTKILQQAQTQTTKQSSFQLQL